MQVAERFAASRRAKLHANLSYSGWLILIACLFLAAGFAPLYAGWWDAAWPAAIGTAIAVLLILAVVINTPLEAFVSLAVYFENDRGQPAVPWKFGRALYRESGRLETLALEAGLPPLSAFDSDDPLDTKALPRWHDPAAALPTVEHLLSRIDASQPLHAHLQYLRAALEAARVNDARFYLMVLSWAGGTNARVEALRRGDLSVISPR
jgi:hypothetical protein